MKKSLIVILAIMMFILIALFLIPQQMIGNGSLKAISKTGELLLGVILSFYSVYYMVNGLTSWQAEGNNKKVLIWSTIIWCSALGVGYLITKL